MDYKSIAKAGGKFIDGKPPSRSNVTQRQNVNGQVSIKKGIRLSSVQIIAPILIAAVGIAVIYLIPDELPWGTHPKDAPVGTSQVAPSQTTASLSPSAPASSENTPAPSQKTAPRPWTLKKPPPANATLVQEGKVKTETVNTTKSPTAATAEPQGRDEKQISLVNAVVCEGVQDHQPMVEKSAFSIEDSRRVYVWMEVRSKTQPFVIKHIYYLNGQKSSEVPLQIKYPRMRTWSYMTIDKPAHIGDWRVDVVWGETILKTVEFRVREGV